MDNKITIIFGRNNELWWDGLLRLLGDVPDTQVIKVCLNSEDVIKSANELQPDMVLIDEEIPGGDHGSVIEDIRQLDKKINIVMVIKPYKKVELAAPFKARAKAFINKDISIEELLNAIRCVARGGIVVISQEVSAAILEHLAHSSNPIQNTRPEYNINLSNRELEVLALLAKEPTSNKEIAKSLFITENTVKSHLQSILSKMKVTSRKQAAELAIKAGLVCQYSEDGETQPKSPKLVRN